MARLITKLPFTYVWLNSQDLMIYYVSVLNLLLGTLKNNEILIFLTMALLNITYYKTFCCRNFFKHLFLEKFAIKNFIKNSQLTEP